VVWEAFLERDIDDISRPDLIRERPMLEIHQAKETLGWISRGWRTRLLADRP